jgi:hypothetical protein
VRNEDQPVIRESLLELRLDNHLSESSGMGTQEVSSASVLRRELLASGGQAMWIRPLQ